MFIFCDFFCLFIKCPPNPVADIHFCQNVFLVVIFSMIDYISDYVCCIKYILCNHNLDQSFAKKRLCKYFPELIGIPH